MKSNTKKIIALFMVLTLTVCFSSCSVSDMNAPKFKEVEGGYALYRYKSTSVEKEFVVPDTYENKPVVEMMSFSAANAEYLEKITIGKNVKTIDPWALTNCHKLKEIVVDENNLNFVSVDGVLYNKDMTVLLCYPNSKSPIEWSEDGKYVKGGVFTVPNTVTEIRANAFYLCNDLYKLTLNDGLQKIGDMAFIKCTNLSELKIPSTVSELGADAFSYCNSLKELTIPSNVKSLGDYAFFSTASKLEKIVVCHDENSSDFKVGKDWIPVKENTMNSKVAVEYVGEK